MPGEVVNISDGVVVIDRDGVNPFTIETAEAILAKATAGEIVGIAAAYTFADGSVGTIIGGQARTLGIIGALTQMATRMSME